MAWKKNNLQDILAKPDPYPNKNIQIKNKAVSKHKIEHSDSESLTESCPT